MTITLRSTKGGKLSFTEMDGNFTNLDTRTTALETVTTAAWQDMRGEVSTAGLGSPATVSIYKDIFQLYTFSGNTKKEISVMFHVPKDYVDGTDIFPHMHIMSAEGQTGTAIFGMTWSWANEWDKHDQQNGPPSSHMYFSTPETATFTHTFDATCPDAHIVLETAQPRTLTGLSTDAIIMMKVWRDAENVLDTCTSDIFLLFVDIYYRSQKFGSTYR